MRSEEAAVAAPTRRLPPVSRFLDEPRVAAFETFLGRQTLKEHIGAVLDCARAAQSQPAFEALLAGVLNRIEIAHGQTLQPVINATGILLHTNLGRAPFSGAAIVELQRVAGGYSNLEFDLERGARSSRYGRAVALIAAATSAEDALVVNNCAAAVLLILDTFAKAREVVVARSELIEIGGGFRLPEVLERTGAELIEVGATNKVYLHDYERALSPRTALLMRAHPSNYQISGFTQSVAPRDLVALGKRSGIPVIEDLGSGALVDLAEYGLPHERTVREAIADGLDLVTFSGDKMLGGPQAGIIAGRTTLIARLRANPLLRALRVDKLTLAALSETLRLTLSSRRDEIPFFHMVRLTPEELRARASGYTATIPGAQIVESIAYAGGGSLPQSAIDSIAVSIAPKCGADDASAALRRANPPIVARIENQRLLLDLRTIDPAQDALVIAALRAL